MNRENILMKIWRVIYPVGIYFLISNVISVVYVMIIAIFMQSNAIANGKFMDAATFQTDLTSLVYKNTMALTSLAAAIAIPIIFLILKKDTKKENVKYEKCNIMLYGLIVIVAGAACLGGNQLLTISRLDQIFPGVNEVQEALYGGGIVMEVLAAVILAPIVEELLFRGLAFKRLYKYVGKVPAMLLSSLFFGIYHGNVVQGIYAFAVGMLFVFIYDRYKTIAAPILAHMFANLISILSVETKIFDFLYSSDLNFIISTVVEVVICIVILFIMYRKVKRSEIVREELMESDLSRIINN